jgi:hypothetical protein
MNDSLPHKSTSVHIKEYHLIFIVAIKNLFSWRDFIVMYLGVIEVTRVN